MLLKCDQTTKQMNIFYSFKRFLKKNIFHQSLPEYVGKQLLNEVQLFSLLKKKRFTGGCANTLDGKYLFYRDSLSLVEGYKEIFWDSIYDILDASLKDIVIIDIGANIGLASLRLAFTHPSAESLAMSLIQIYLSALKKILSNLIYPIE